MLRPRSCSSTWSTEHSVKAVGTALASQVFSQELPGKIDRALDVREVEGVPIRMQRFVPDTDIRELTS